MQRYATSHAPSSSLRAGPSPAYTRRKRRASRRHTWSLTASPPLGLLEPAGVEPVLVLAEVPTGVIADRFGRRVSLTAGFVCGKVRKFTDHMYGADRLTRRVPPRWHPAAG